MYAAILTPNLALQSILRSDPLLRNKPVAVLENSSRRSLVLQVNSLAEENGIKPGIVAAKALARCAEIVIRYRSLQQECASQRLLRDAALTISPRVEKTRENLYTINLIGVRRQSLQHRFEKLVAHLHKLGLEAQIGIAHYALTALYAARCADSVFDVGDGKNFLSQLDLKEAEPSEKIHSILRQWGIHTLGDLVALPKEEIGKRLGEEGLALWDRATGRESRVLQYVSLPERFDETLELEHELETLEPLLFLLRHFIDQISLRLEAAYLVTKRIDLRLKLRNGTVYQRQFNLPEPSRKADLIFRMLETHLEAVQTEHSIIAVYLRAEPCRANVRQQGFFDINLKSPYRFAETVARLGAIVGSTKVGNPVLESTHRPEAFHLKKLGTTTEKNSPAKPLKRALPLLGLILRRFRPEVRAQVTCNSAHCPEILSSRIVSGHILSYRGPWRRSGNWWERDRKWSQEEWDVELTQGGIYRLSYKKHFWSIEGIYD
jgi:protein ImuB